MAFSIIYSVVDAKNLPSTFEVNIPGATTFANVTIFAAELAKLIDPLLQGAITRIGVAFSVTLPGALKAAALAGADVEEGAKFQYRTVGGFFTNLRLPTFLEDLVSATGREVDLDDTDVAAFNTAMKTGINLTGAGGTGTVQPCDKREADITALDFAKEQFVSSRG